MIGPGWRDRGRREAQNSADLGGTLVPEPPNITLHYR